MNHAIYKISPSLPVPLTGMIVQLDSHYYILATIQNNEFALIGLIDGNRWYNPGPLAWDNLTLKQSHKIQCIWPNIKLFLKDVNL